MKLSRVPVVFAALPLAVIGLSGAAPVPEPQMFVGAMTDVVSATDGCPPVGESVVTGHWSARFDGSDVVMVHLKIKLDGKRDTHWLAPFTGALTADGFSAVAHVPWPDGSVDTQTVTLDGDQFTYDLDSVFFNCHVVVAGTLGR